MSSDADLMISVRGLGKAYTIAQSNQRASTLAEAVIARVRRPLHRPANETFWALKDVSFDVHRGDVVGVIGRNGAGKSTLFKVLSRITEPTTGQVDLYGRVGSLLEVGTGFSGELTGRENIYLNGTILGMRRSEITKRFDEIVDFAGVEKFLDTPVKRYSSGMYVRLAFAVAAHLDSEILIVDEVLAVGDAQFQAKCLGRIHQVATAGRTVLVVSHQRQVLENIATRGLLLDEGRLALDGAGGDIARIYGSTHRPDGRAGKNRRALGPLPCVTTVSVESQSGRDYILTGEDIIIRFKIWSPDQADSLTLSFVFEDHEHQSACFVCYLHPSGRLSHHQLGRLLRGESTVTCRVTAFPGYKGRYAIRHTLFDSNLLKVLDEGSAVAEFQVEVPADRIPGVEWRDGQAKFLCDFRWTAAELVD